MVSIDLQTMMNHLKSCLGTIFWCPSSLQYLPLKGLASHIYNLSGLCLHEYIMIHYVISTRILVLATVLDSWGRGRFEWHGMIEHSERNETPGETFSPTYPFVMPYLALARSVAIAANPRNMLASRPWNNQPPAHFPVKLVWLKMLYTQNKHGHNP